MSVIDLEHDFAALLTNDAPAMPAEVEAVAGEHLADLVGVALAAVGEPAFHALLSAFQSAPGLIGWSRVWGAGVRCSRRDAGLINAFAGHFHDFDDDETELAMAHVTVTAMTAAATVADSLTGISGREVLQAYTLGVEAATRLGRLINPDHYKSGWHASATLGVFAATAASGHVLGLDPTSMRHALGMAASFASGLRSNFGSDTKPLQVGHAVERGILASELAAKGMTSTPGSLLGPRGYVSFFGPKRDAAKVLDGFGAPYDLVGSGLTIKAYPCCTASHTAVDSMLALRDEHRFGAGEIERITCHIDPAVPNILVHDRPANATEAKFSLPFCIAAAAVFGQLRISEFTSGVVHSPEVRAVMERVVVELDPSLPKGDSGISVSSRLTIQLQDGSRLTRFNEFVPGSPRRRLSHRRLFEKFEACTRGLLGSERTDGVFDALLNAGHADEFRTVVDLISDAPAAHRSH